LSLRGEALPWESVFGGAFEKAEEEAGEGGGGDGCDGCHGNDREGWLRSRA
jgi:hypothetical protein